MPKQKLNVKHDRKSIQVNVGLSPILRDELQRFVDLEYFSNVSDGVRYEIHEMLTKFRDEKLPSPFDDSQNRTKNAQLVDGNKGEVE